MTLAQSVGAYLRVHPVGFVDGIRLFTAYFIALVLKMATPNRFNCVGVLLAGDDNIHVKVDGIEFEVRPRTNDLDIVSPKHEPVTRSWFTVMPEDVVVDVGAHIGRYTVLGARRGAKVLSIEPDPANFEMLVANVNLNHASDVVSEQVAVSDAGGLRLFLLSGGPNRGTSSLAPETHSEARERGVLVQCKTLDELVTGHGLTRIDWLKIDVEGHEVEALRGASRCLSITRRLSLEVTAESEAACRLITDRAGFRIEAEERGVPASNLLMRKA